MFQFKNLYILNLNHVKNPNRVRIYCNGICLRNVIYIVVTSVNVLQLMIIFDEAWQQRFLNKTDTWQALVLFVQIKTSTLTICTNKRVKYKPIVYIINK